MKSAMTWTVLGAALCFAATSFAQAPADAPAGSTGLCKDGTYSQSASKSGACSGHKGVQQWFGSASSTSAGSGSGASSAAPAAAAPATPAPAAASAAAGAPAGSTGLCKDGTYSQSASKSGACSGHKGVKQWFGSASSGSTGMSAGAAATAPAAPAMPATRANPPVAATAPAPAAKPAATTAAIAPGGGPGMVWVNTSSNVYHCQGDQWYGKTKHGAYMSEADAKAKGARPDHGKPCQS